MALNLGTLSAAVTLDDAEYRSKLSGLEGQSAGTFKRIAQLAASYLTLRALTQFGANAAKAYMTQQDAVENLNAALRNTGAEVDGNSRKFQDLASELQKVTKFGDEGTLAAITQGLNLKVQVADIPAATKAAMVLAQKYQMDLATAMMLVGRASQGQTSMLTRYGIVLSDTMSSEEKYRAILKMGEEEFGLVTAAAQTASGRLAQFGNAAGDAMEVVGAAVLDGVRPAIELLHNLVNGFNSLDPAAQKLIVSTGALAAALGLLSATGALNTVTGLGRAALTAAASQGVLAAATHGVTAAFTALNAALGPIGWAILALGAAYLSVKYLIDKENAALARNVELAQKNADAAKEHAAANEKQRREASTLMERLETLSKYERLNSAEQQEAKTAIEKLTAVYGDLGIRLDETTGKILIAAGAWNKLTEAQYNQAKQDLNAQQDTAQKLFGAYGQRAARTFENTKNSSRVDFMAFLDTLGLRSDEENLEALEKFRADSLAEGNDEAAADLKGMVEQYKAVIDARKKLVSLEEAHRNGQKQQTEEEQRRTSEELRKAQESFNDAKWKIEFDNAAPVKQARMLQEKIQKIFEKQSGKYGTLADFENADPAKMNAQELADLKQILELEEERRRIREESAEAFRSEEQRYAGKLYADARQRLFANQKAQYEKLQGPARARFAQGKADEYNKLGDAFQAQYKKALEAAKADSFISKEEQSQLDKLFEKMETAFSDGERWADLARQAKEGKGTSEREVRQSVGDWSLAALSAMLGGQNYNQQIAANTRRSITLEQEIARNTKNGTSGAARIAYA